MPSLFNRRSRSVSTSRPVNPASSSAHLAAAQAFLASQPSHSNLSASAAATALRTMSPPPTPVNQVQTKRMLSRQTSQSSIASAPRGRSSGPVQRRPSAGSMTERTFRTPSPAQTSPRTGPVTGAGRGAPPVPPLPQPYTEDLPRTPAQAHRRAVSMDAPTARVASSPATKAVPRGQKTTQTSPASSAATAAARSSIKPQQPHPLQRSDSQDSRNSYNFSYPRGSRPSSPPPRSSLVSSEALASGPVGGLSAAETSRIQNELTQTASRPVKKKKPRVDPSSVEGSYLQSGTMGSKPVVTPLEPLSSELTAQDDAHAVKKPRKKATLSGQSSHFPSHDEQPSQSSSAESPPDRRAQRASGVLMKQPSVVQEDWEGENEEQDAPFVDADSSKPAEIQHDIIAEPVQPKKDIPEANMSRKIEELPNTSKNATSIHNVVGVGSTSAPASGKKLSAGSSSTPTGRGVSISPSRSTRFSDRLASDLASGRKHEPLARSISPAKSAMKHSVISDYSPTDPKFPGRRGSSVTPSEASDISDGFSTKRKSARVSFEGVADNRDATAESKTTRDQGKRTWLGFAKGKSTALDPIAADEVDEGLVPRPALPSFGSVRRGDRSASPTGRDIARESQGVADHSPSSSEASSILDPPTLDTSVSSDHALGKLISEESQKSTATSTTYKHSKLLSAATVGDGTGYVSDTDSVYSEEETPYRSSRSGTESMHKDVANDEYASKYRDEIPEISVLPATPGLDEEQSGKEWAQEAPGAFPPSTTSSNTSSQTSVANEGAPPADDVSAISIPRSAQDYTSSQKDNSANSSSQLLMTIAEESDNDSLYSDAAEDLSDIEGDGFGSINAIVESPVVGTVHRQVVVPESPLAAKVQPRSTDAEATSSWDSAQAHWSDLAQRTRNSTSMPVQAADVPSTMPSSKTGPTTDQQKSLQQMTAPSARADLEMKKQTAATRLSSQAAPSAVIATKTVSKPIVAKQQAPLRSSMRGQTEPLNIQAKQRPASYTGSSYTSPSAPASASRAALQKKQIPTAAPTPAPPPKGLMRTFSNDDDSDSSFKKARRARRPADGRFAMKKSMRSGPPEPQRSEVPTGRGGVRSLSPPVNRRPTSPMGIKTLRTSMRGSNDYGTPTLRDQPEAKRPSSLFSRNRKAMSPPRPTAAASGLTSKIKSRFADSDDEDGPRPTQFKSRFANSSDEEDGPSFRPVRGIPKRKDDADSTDLDDSSDEETARKSQPAPAKKLTIVPPLASQEVLSPPVSPTTAKKRGFWGRLRGGKKKDGDEEFETPTTATPIEPEVKKKVVQPSKEEINEAKQLGFQSPAERDAMIEQTRLKLEAAREQPQSLTPQVGSPPASPPGKLQRRATPQRVFSDSFVQPKVQVVDEGDRPQTSAGDGEPSRPAVGSRQPTSDTINGDGVYGKGGKKKRFGRLRRVFGLYD